MVRISLYYFENVYQWSIKFKTEEFLYVLLMVKFLFEGIFI